MNVAPSQERLAVNLSFTRLFAQESIRIRCTQARRTLPVVALSLIALEFALRGRVESAPLHFWQFCMMGAILGRAVLCTVMRKHINNASLVQLNRFESYLWISATLNAIVMGSAFWLVAANGDLTVRLIMTLLSCFYAIGALVNASSHFASFAAVTAIHLGQGVLFWLGIGSANPAQLAVAIPYLAAALLMLGFGREYSRQFRESLQIRTENAELLAQLAKDKQIVENALSEAKLASESKSRFLAAASHDLRQPLHALTMFLGTLSFHVATDDAKRLLGRVKETAHVLEEQFNSLLDLSRFDAGAVETDIQAFRLDKLVERLIEEFRPDASARQLAISSETPTANARSDRILIRRMLENLIENALKYTKSGFVAIRVSDLSTEYRVEIADSGPGIPKDQQSRIFEEYVQLSNPARQRRHGAGLGLAIVRRIDNLLRLRLTLDSDVGSGSRFSFYVPKASSEEMISSHQDFSVDSTSFTTSINVWVLDDDPVVLESIREQLSVWGAGVQTFSRAVDLVAELRETSSLPHWILTDDMLGSELSGLETAQILSREFGFGRVCLVTGNTEPRRLAQLRSSGFPVIVKPATPEALISLLQS